MISNLDIFDGFVVLQPKKINNLDLHCLKVKMRTRGIHKLHLTICVGIPNLLRSEYNISSN